MFSNGSKKFVFPDGYEMNLWTFFANDNVKKFTLYNFVK